MLADRESKFRIYSLGIVVNNKQRGSPQVTVYPVEDLAGIKGDISKAGGTSVISVTDASGATKANKATSQSTIVANWIPLNNSNRTTPPDVYMNETVVIYRYADTGEYYWNTIFGEPSLRKLEDVTYSFSNVKNPNGTFDANSSYYIRYNTFDKFIHLHTSTNDGEKAGYDLVIDTGNGVLSLSDTLGNSLVLDSVAGDLNATTTKSVEVNTQKTTVNSGIEVTINSPTVTVNANSETIVNTPVATVNASSEINLNAPVTNVSGDLNVGGSIAFGIKTGTNAVVGGSGTVNATTFNGALNGHATSASYIG